MTAEQQQWQMLAVFAVLTGLGLLEWLSGRFFPRNATREDNWLDLAMTLLMPLTSASILSIVMAACAWLLPTQRGAWADWPWWGMLGVLLLADDLTQYFWHRLSHTWKALWPLHRAHHSAGYMSVRLTFRNNLFYYAMMPGLWLAAVLVYLGFGWVYVGYTIVKMSVIIAAHCALPWDRALIARPALAPLLWLLEHTISTPATHFAHHALNEDDGIGHYNGNYGNLLFLWDVIFGTARFSRRYPPAYGLSDDLAHGPESWLTQIIYPLLRSRRAGSDLARPTAAKQ